MAKKRTLKDCEKELKKERKRKNELIKEKQKKLRSKKSRYA